MPAQLPATAAVHAVLPPPLPLHRYLEQPDSGLVLTAGSLAVELIGSDTHMHIDPATAQAGAGLGLG